MNDDPRYPRLRETSWRRALTDAEAAEVRAWLAAHPEARSDWATEAQLNRALRTLKNVPVASNFTARVVQAVEHETSAAPTVLRPVWRARWRALGWVPKAAVAAGVLGLSVLSVHRYQAVARAQMVRGILAFSEVKSLPSPEILQDFDAINRLSVVPPPDEQLLAALK